jgi:hypothetical protein
MNYLRPLLIILFISLFVNVIAQNRFQPGIIYFKNGETKIGLINFQNEIDIKNECQFKADKKASTIKYIPSEINGFKIGESKAYISKKVMIDDKEKFVFLEYLVDGIADLYFMKDDDRNYHFYIQNEGDSLRELKNTEINFNRNDIHFTKKMKEYINTLEDVFKNSPEIVSELKNVPFYYKNLIIATKRYHDYVCNDYKCVVYSKKIKPEIFLGFKVGTNNSVILFNAKDYYYQKLEYELIKLVPTYYLGISLTQTNLMGSENLNQTVSIGYLRDHYQMVKTTIKQDNLWIPMYFTKTFPIGNIKPFLDFGISNVIMLKSSITSNLNEAALQKTIGKYQLNALLGLGAEYYFNNQSVLITSRIEMGGGINSRGNISNNYLKSNNIRLSLDLTYRFKLN